MDDNDKIALFNIDSDTEFITKALSVFRYQAENNAIFRQFLNHLNCNPKKITKIKDIPFLPIQFFKSHEVLCDNSSVQKTFLSSGTSGIQQSKHLVADISLYEKSYLKGFSHFYGDISDYTVLALLPAYLEREGSSLTYMVADLIKKSNKPHSGFYLNNLTELADTLNTLDSRGEKILLIGVSFALLDLIESFSFNLRNAIIMETGGMKGRRKELVRNELHQQLSKGFGVEKIHSEYGMTELLSQAYSRGNGHFYSPPWMKIMIRDAEDALSLGDYGETGGINVIDLANVNSCAFIATQDLGKTHINGSFEILGRFDNSDIRGCNLMVI